MRWRSADLAAGCAARPKSAPTKKMVARAIWSEVARRRSPPRAMPDVHGQDAARERERRDRLDPRPLRPPRHRSRLWWNPLFRACTPVAVRGGFHGAARGRGPAVLPVRVRETAGRDEKSWLLPLMLRPALPFTAILWRI